MMSAGLETVLLCNWIEEAGKGNKITLRYALEVLKSLEEVRAKLRMMDDGGHAQAVDGLRAFKRIRSKMRGQIESLWGLEDGHPSVPGQPRGGGPHSRVYHTFSSNKKGGK